MNMMNMMNMASNAIYVYEESTFLQRMSTRQDLSANSSQTLKGKMVQSSKITFTEVRVPKVLGKVCNYAI